MRLDQDGQPTAGFNAERRSARDLSEMLGIVRGLLADGVVNEAEVRMLHQWTDANAEAVSCWPGSQIHERLLTILEDGVVDPDEIADLKGLMEDLVGGEDGFVAGMQAATALPLDKPPPAIVLPERMFVFTGKFAFGPRKACEQVVESFGGRHHSGVTKETNFLVIGTFGSRDWINSSYGTKILKAVEYRDRGQPLAIVSEEHWAGCLPR